MDRARANHLGLLVCASDLVQRFRNTAFGSGWPTKKAPAKTGRRLIALIALPTPGWIEAATGNASPARKVWFRRNDDSASELKKLRLELRAAPTWPSYRSCGSKVSR